MNLSEQYERFKDMEQTPETILIRKKLETFINKTQHVEMLADHLSRQVKELERMGDELDKEEKEISKLISINLSMVHEIPIPD